jgi:cell division topological specificity factor
VIAKYVQIDEKKVEVSFERGGDYSTLEVNIELPPPSPEKSVRARGAGAGDAAAAAKRA